MSKEPPDDEWFELSDDLWLDPGNRRTRTKVIGGGAGGSAFFRTSCSEPSQRGNPEELEAEGMLTVERTYTLEE